MLHSDPPLVGVRCGSLDASGERADSSKSGQVVFTDLSDSGSDIDISALVEQSDQNLSSSPVTFECRRCVNT